MSTDREKAIERLNMEAETKADHAFPDNPSEGANLGFQHGFIAGRTISREQVEKAAEAAYASTGSPIAWEVVSKPQRQTYRKQARAALEAAGLVIEDK